MKKIVELREDNCAVNFAANGKNIEMYFKNKPYLNTTINFELLLNFINVIRCYTDGGCELSKKIKTNTGTNYCLAFKSLEKDEISKYENAKGKHADLLISINSDTDYRIEAYFFVDCIKFISMLQQLINEESIYE